MSHSINSRVNSTFPNPNSGVADYFAILGMGEKLVLKKSKNNKNVDEINIEIQLEKNQDEEAQMMERFYREIVEIRFFSDWEKHLQKSHNMNEDKKDTAPTTSNEEIRNDQHFDAKAQDEKHNQPNPATCSIEGLNIVTQTISAGFPSSSSSIYPAICDTFEDENISSKSKKIIWKMGQTFNANLNPYMGLRSEIRSTLIPETSPKKSKMIDSTSSKSDIDTNYQSPSSKFRSPSLFFRDKSLQFIPPIAETQTNLNSQCSSYHIGYRRRGADEGNKPAISNVELLYVSVPSQNQYRNDSPWNEKSNSATIANDINSLAKTKRSSASNQDTVSKSAETKGIAMVHTQPVAALKRGLATGAGIAARAGLGLFQRENAPEEDVNNQTSDSNTDTIDHASQSSVFNTHIRVPLLELLDVPEGYDELILPNEYQHITIPPSKSMLQHGKNSSGESNAAKEHQSNQDREKRRSQRRLKRTFLFTSTATNDSSSADNEQSGYGEGVEAFVDGASFLRSPSNSPEKIIRNLDLSSPSYPSGANDHSSPFSSSTTIKKHCVTFIQFPMPIHKVNSLSSSEAEVATANNNYNNFDIDVVPVVAIRYQRFGDEERFHEDSAITDFAVSFCDEYGRIVMPSYQDIEEDEDEDEGICFLSKTQWAFSGISIIAPSTSISPKFAMSNDIMLGTPAIITKRNFPMGFADAPFATSVLDRFPKKNYKGLPLPEEELPMFCYPTGCRLERALFRDAPLPSCYGFVVKNERGDSLYVSCISFKEPLTHSKTKQLNQMSMRRRKTSLPHRRYCARNSFKEEINDTVLSEQGHGNDSNESKSTFNDFLVTGFDQMTTFENKTLCLVSRFPHWTAFRRFLSHLHIMSGSSSEIPLERYISHLLFSVPVPKPGGSAIIIPLPTISEPMVLEMPPKKDLPLLDLSYHRLFACLDVPMVVTIVLGFLTLERKVIIMSTHPSLVLDGCELLRSLLFPFELCAPYVPRLTQPFMSCLEFPGAIFVGIHDDGSSDGLATIVRENIPEDTIIVDLDTGEISCDQDRYGVLKQCWGIIPTQQRKSLVSEIETLCKDAGIVPGQEPVDSQIDLAFNAPLPNMRADNFGHDRENVAREPLDDRAIRDTFLRFFCSVLEGYERYLVVPDMDFLISGNEWFDSKGFLAAAPQDKAPFLGCLVTTQLFQSFIQRRTEASDLHCMLFDDCQTEFLSSHDPYGRLGVEDYGMKLTPESESRMTSYDLLVDQCATESSAIVATDALESDNLNYSVMEVMDEDQADGQSNFSFSDADTSMTMGPVSGYRFQTSFTSLNTTLNSTFHGFNVGNTAGDIVTFPSRESIPKNSRFVYCIDGQPSFPQKLNKTLFLPLEPDNLLTDMSEMPVAILTRSDRELNEANTRRKIATSHGNSLNKQRRCLWQLPKLLASHFLGAWLLCIPSQISQSKTSPEQKARFLLRAFGALRLLKSRQRIVPDEASYRALMVACGRSKSDRRVELVKLFGLLRSDGIFPSAVTLGQYTRAIAEGFSRRTTEIPESDNNEESTFGSENPRLVNIEHALNALDENLGILEEAGRKWRQRLNNRDGSSKGENPIDVTMDIEHNSAKENFDELNNISEYGLSGDTQAMNRSSEKKKITKVNRKSQYSWSPISYSSSFAPLQNPNTPAVSPNNENIELQKSDFKFVCMWSRVSSCESCNYILLDEEVQAGWDVMQGDHEMQANVVCPRCNSVITPKLGYHEMALESIEKINFTRKVGEHLPPQLGSSLLDLEKDLDQLESNDSGYVPYLSPPILRLLLEKHIEELGESVLERETLQSLDPTVFYNLWWYCLRFSLPFPLPVACQADDDGTLFNINSSFQLSTTEEKNEKIKHLCGFGSWDRTTAIEGCISGAKCILTFLESLNEGKKECEKCADALSTAPQKSNPPSASIQTNHNTMLSYFNLQTYTQGDWDQVDLAKILVTLVEACDKRDFSPVLECVIRCNRQRMEKQTGQELLLLDAKKSSRRERRQDHANTSSGKENTLSTNLQLDCYRTILYLAKYQCTTAFHVFFPATSKACKGYHFWCSTGAPLPIFDRLFREAVIKLNGKEDPVLLESIYCASDIALGFRCTFGHVL